MGKKPCAGLKSRIVEQWFKDHKKRAGNPNGNGNKNRKKDRNGR